MLKISVVTAVYNRKATIGQALDSVLGQTWPNVECVIIDGASSDGTQDVVKSKLPTSAKFISERDSGIYDALNKGIRASTGDVVGFMHADDLYADSEVLARVAKAFEDPDVDVVYGDLLYVDKDDVSKTVRYWKSRPFERSLLRKGWMPAHPTFYVRKSVYDRMGHFDTQYRIAADYDAMLRILSHEGIGVAYIPSVLVKMRVGGASNASVKAILRKSSEDLNIVRRNGIGGLYTIFVKNISKVPQFFKKHRLSN